MLKLILKSFHVRARSAALVIRYACCVHSWFEADACFLLEKVHMKGA